MKKALCLASLWLLVGVTCAAAAAGDSPTAVKIGTDLYAYISDNDGSANSTFLVGHDGILVVDTGVDAKEGAKLLHAIREISPLPIAFIVNTHYHPDHQGGNATVGSSSMGTSATIVATNFTRERSLALMHEVPAFESTLHPAQVTFSHSMTIHLDPYVAEIYFLGKAHTSGDALVYFPQQQVIATGDLFLNRSSPAMDHGSVKNWIDALDGVLQKPLQAVVPGHFELGSRADLQRFHDYLHDLYRQVQASRAKGLKLEQIKTHLRTEKYKDYRQYPQYEATFADNAATIYEELEHP